MILYIVNYEHVDQMMESIEQHVISIAELVKTNTFCDAPNILPTKNIKIVGINIIQVRREYASLTDTVRLTSLRKHFPIEL